MSIININYKQLWNFANAQMKNDGNIKGCTFNLWFQNQHKSIEYINIICEYFFYKKKYYIKIKIIIVFKQYLKFLKQKLYTNFE